VTAERILEKKGHKVFSVDEGVTLKAVIAELARHRVGVLLVTNTSDDKVGIISERDVIAVLAQDPDAMQRTAGSMMTSLMVKCSLDDSEGDLMDRMVKAHVRHLPVHHAGKVVGLVSARDVMNLRMEKLQELMKDIMSEVARKAG
jgi:signal-transduction protein with cAMP-binding, CBS, and nucleotidyltransferase domain